MAESFEGRERQEGRKLAADEIMVGRIGVEGGDTLHSSAVVLQFVQRSQSRIACGFRGICVHGARCGCGR